MFDAIHNADDDDDDDDDDEASDHLWVADEESALLTGEMTFHRNVNEK